MDVADITGAGLMDADITGAEGGEMIPLLVGALGAMYSVGQAYDSMRYWSAYKRNTGFSPRYPFRSKSMDALKYGAATGYSFSKLRRL